VEEGEAGYFGFGVVGVVGFALEEVAGGAG